MTYGIRVLGLGVGFRYVMVSEFGVQGAGVIKPQTL